MTQTKTRHFLQILDGAYAPITNGIGFLEAPIESILDAERKWCDETVGQPLQVERIEPDQGIGQSFLALEPLGAPRWLWLETAGPWMAHFESSTDPGNLGGLVPMLSRQFRCRGVAATCKPDTIAIKTLAYKRHGEVQFWYFDGAEENENVPELARSRSIAVTHDRSWRFNIDGAPLPFERTDGYETPIIRDRFTPELLGEYCRAVGIDLFNPAFYRGTGYVLSHTEPEGCFDRPSLAEVRARRGLPPPGQPWLVPVGRSVRRKNLA